MGRKAGNSNPEVEKAKMEKVRQGRITKKNEKQEEEIKKKVLKELKPRLVHEILANSDSSSDDNEIESSIDSRKKKPMKKKQVEEKPDLIAEVHSMIKDLYETKKNKNKKVTIDAPVKQTNDVVHEHPSRNSSLKPIKSSFFINK